MIPAVIGHGLDEVLFGESAFPPQCLVNGTVNPEYRNWIRNNQLLLSWLRSLISEGILGPIAQYNTSSSVLDCESIRSKSATAEVSTPDDKER